MAATLEGQQTHAKPIAIRSAGMKLDTPRLHTTKHGITSVDIMSPVNQNGCFEFDRIIKAGTVVKRTRKTKSWKPIYVVLRPNCLSIYKDKDETKLRHQINLSEITAVARQRDSKRKMDHVFGIFSPARNYHLGASTDKEAQEWVLRPRYKLSVSLKVYASKTFKLTHEGQFSVPRHAFRGTTGEEEAEMTVMSPTTGKTTFAGFGRPNRENTMSSSSETEPRPSSSMPERMYSARRPSQALNYSGGEHGSISDFDFSDTNMQGSVQSLPPKTPQQTRNFSQQSNIGATPDDERVVYHGWLYLLKSKGGVRQWRKIWVVLRPKYLTFYKNDEEYSATHIIPFSSIIDAVDIDPVSRSKQYCMQVIGEEKNYKFCASDENSLAKWLGAFKSLLVKKREGAQQRAQQGPPNPANVQQPQMNVSPLNIPAPAQQPVAMR